MIVQISCQDGSVFQIESDIVLLEVNEHTGALMVDRYDMEMVRIGWHLYNARCWTRVHQIAPPSPEAIAAMEAFEKESEPSEPSGKFRFPNY